MPIAISHASRSVLVVPEEFSFAAVAVFLQAEDGGILAEFGDCSRIPFGRHGMLLAAVRANLPGSRAWNSKCRQMASDPLITPTSKFQIQDVDPSVELGRVFGFDANMATLLPHSLARWQFFQFAPGTVD